MIMIDFNRRTFVTMSVGSVAALGFPRFAVAAAQCAPAGQRAFLPDHLTVDCASRQNFHAFRTYPDDLGLAGVVSMMPVSGKLGSYNAGNLFLFPWLKPAGQKLEAKQHKTWPSVAPTSTTLYTAAKPIPNATLPVDEYFCRFVLQAPWTSFIGFQVDIPFSKAEGTQHWFGNVEKLADGKGVGIDWTSSNLNKPWFDGSSSIPDSDTCNGNAWRRIIVDGINQASAGVCYPAALR